MFLNIRFKLTMYTVILYQSSSNLFFMLPFYFVLLHFNFRALLSCIYTIISYYLYFVLLYKNIYIYISTSYAASSSLLPSYSDVFHLIFTLTNLKTKLCFYVTSLVLYKSFFFTLFYLVTFI